MIALIVNLHIFLKSNQPFRTRVITFFLFNLLNVLKIRKKNDLLIPNDNLLDKNLKYKQPSFSSKEITGKFWENNVLVSSEIHKILKPNTQYTISYNYEITDLSDKAFPDFNIRIGFVLWEKDDIQNRNRYLFATNFKTKNVKKYYSKTFTTPSEIPSTYELLVYSNRYDAENGDYDMDTVRISNIKLEEGSKATPYVE